jgi:hypothetical protein
MKVDNEKFGMTLERKGNGVLVSMAFFDLEEMKLSKNQTVEGLDVWFENTMLQEVVTDHQVLIYPMVNTS